MRAEEIEKEAALFERENECYIHIQRCDGAPFTMVAAGDPRMVLQSVYTLLCFLESNNDLPFRQALKLLRQGRRYMLKQEKKENHAA